MFETAQFTNVILHIFFLQKSPGGPHCTVQYVELRGYCQGHGTALCMVGGGTSQLDLPSLTPLSVADCGRLQLGSPNWATSVNYCK